MNHSEKTSAPALDRGLTILELVAGRKSGIGFNDIAEELGLPPSSVARFIKVLIQRNYIEKDELHGLYVPGRAIEFLAGKAATEKLRELSVPVLRSLRDKTSNTVLVIHWNNVSLECVAKEMHESSMAMQNVGEIRTDILSYPWSVFIFHHMQEENKINTLKRYANAEELREELEAQWAYFEKNGYSRNLSLHHRRLTAPLYIGDTFCGALALGGTVGSIPDEKIDNIANELKLHAAMLNDKIAKETW